eukprot:CAMPEP_0182928174 /NCGR_PEP_ID=MMETSP0105_2-20130417/15422_1 /TAXON_ID=81532 ORGANISM="Acanthoeca-like sp., Strain 10tr" /NCGR_SAMPLE_ID=MMETSP0105_2 /ASSEMBLY_ACC=CAM_ASM_000205 /LENGTH=432 /DNA_ID=CAMNT_0025066173 /DNA_START=166 /DNA_END=1463 /DNA_ORIENTATION=+
MAAAAGAQATAKVMEARHGRMWKELAAAMGVEAPALPEAVAVCEDEARPGYTKIDATEYRDSPDVEAAKIELVAQMLAKASTCTAYTGAGISTAAGIGDYATKAKDSHAGSPNKPLSMLSPFVAKPSIAHHALVKLWRAGMLGGGWVQQNHDGLPQKAGLPQEAINEIHGAWFDVSNPVVKMSGQLRTDLFDDLVRIEAEADMCLTLGTSLSGMNADRVAASVAARHAKGDGLGLVIVNLQQTQMDAACAVRLWGLLDSVVARVVERAIAIQRGAAGIPEALGLPVLVGDSATASCDKATDAVCRRNTTDTVEIGYGVDGFKLPEGAPRRALNLAEDAEIVITCGPYAGSRGYVRGRDRMNNIDLTVKVRVKGFMAPVPMKLGHWWMDSGARGAVSRFPIANPDPAPAADQAGGDAASGGTMSPPGGQAANH